MLTQQSYNLAKSGMRKSRQISRGLSTLAQFQAHSQSF